MGRTGGAADEIGRLVQATGGGDVDAFAALYDRTASGVFGFLSRAPGDPVAAERATVRVYMRVWRTAPAFDPAVMSGGAFLLRALLREFDDRERRDDAGRARTAPVAFEDGAVGGCPEDRRDVDGPRAHQLPRHAHRLPTSRCARPGRG